MSDSNYTGRFPRTLQSAFGPYARWHIERHEPWHRRYACAMALALFVVVLVFAVFVEVTR